MRGAGTWNQAALSDEIEFLGSTLSIDVGRWTTTVTGDALSRHLDAFQSVVHTILESPRFEESEFEQLKRQTAADIVQVRENDNMLCQRFLVKQLYQDHSYGRPRKGTLDSLAAITLEDVRQFFAIHYSRFNSLTAAAGDVSENRLRNYAEDILSHLPMERPPVQNVAEVPEPSGIEAVVVDKPGRSQVPVIAGHSTIHANHPDYLALFVGNVAFGGTFTARLSQEIREKRGWSYGAYSSIQADQHVGSFLMRFSPAVKDTVPAIRLAQSMLRDLVETGISDEELRAAKNYLCNSHPFVIDTPNKRLYEMIHQDLTGRAPNWIETYPSLVSNLDLMTVNRALKAHLSHSELVLSVVATADELLEELGHWGATRIINRVDYRSD